MWLPLLMIISYCRKLKGHYLNIVQLILGMVDKPVENLLKGHCTCIFHEKKSQVQPHSLGTGNLSGRNQTLYQLFSFAWT